MQKQSSQTCSCGQAVTFPEGEVKTMCQCGVVWEIDNGGFWFSNLIIRFAPIVAKRKDRKPDHYNNYMGWRARNKRKAGTRC